MFSNFFFENVPFMRCGKIYCRTRKDTDLNIAGRMRTARWIPKATNVHPQQLILPLQRWLHDRTHLTVTLYAPCLSDLLNAYSQKCVIKTPLLVCYRKQQAACHETLCHLMNPNNGKFKPSAVKKHVTPVPICEVGTTQMSAERRRRPPPRPLLNSKEQKTQVSLTRS
jgi:hypothetical protein